jgi:alpha-ketoglutarate-dependent 2,4-dichlorophenoxyacetate dioxygenase
MTMLNIEPLHRLFGGRVTNADLRQPLEDVLRAEIVALMDQYAVLVFPGQFLNQDQQVHFTQSFGDLDKGFKRVSRAPTRFKYDELLDMSNVAPDGTIVDRAHKKIVGNIANQLWHTDSSFQKPSAKYSVLSAVVVTPSGGETEFIDSRVAYDRLPENMKTTLDGLVAEHDSLHSRIALGDGNYDEQQRTVFPPVKWPVVREQKETGRKFLYIGAHARAIDGLTTAEARMLLMDLLEIASHPDLIYRHDWNVGDVVMWDNQITLHRGRRFDLSARRELRRTTTLDLSAAA